MIRMTGPAIERRRRGGDTTGTRHGSPRCAALYGLSCDCRRRDRARLRGGGSAPGPPTCPASDALLCSSLTPPITSRISGHVRSNPGPCKLSIRNSTPTVTMHRRPHDAPHLAAIAVAASPSAWPSKSPTPRKQPPAKSDQDHRPEAVNAKLKQSHRMQQEDQAQHDQNHGSRRNAVAMAGRVCWRDARRHHRSVRARNDACRAIRLRRRSKHALKAERIRYRLPQFESMRRLVSVKHQVKEIREEYRHHDRAEVIRHPDQAHEGHHVRRSPS